MPRPNILVDERVPASLVVATVLGRVRMRAGSCDSPSSCDASIATHGGTRGCDLRRWAACWGLWGAALYGEAPEASGLVIERWCSWCFELCAHTMQALSNRPAQTRARARKDAPYDTRARTHARYARTLMVPVIEVSICACELDQRVERGGSGPVVGAGSHPPPCAVRCRKVQAR